MKLREIFDGLTYGELSQLNLGGAGEGFIDDANYNKMLSHVNLGLTALHTRFVLKMSALELILLPGAYGYHLHSEHRFSDEEVALTDFRVDIGAGTVLVDTQVHADPEYIRDQPYARFRDDILKVEKVSTPAGIELFLNDASDPWSVRTQKDTLLIIPKRIVDGGPDLPDYLKTDRLNVEYRANHPIIQPGAGEYDANRVEVDLPYAYLEALLFYIASRVHNPIGMGQEFNAGNTYYSKYLAICNELETRNLAIDLGEGVDRIQRNGWV